MSKVTIVLTNGRKAGRFPVPVKAGATPLGVAEFDNDLNAHILRLDLETYLKHAHAIANIAKTSPSLWYPLNIEVESEASEREAELMGEIDRLQRELFDANNEIKKLVAMAGTVPAPEPVSDVSKEPSADSEALTTSENAVSNLKQEEEVPAQAEQPALTFDGLKAKTMRENRALAKDLGVPHYTKAKTEAELIETILAHVQTQQNPESNG